MPKPRKNQLIQCTHFAWKLYRCQGVWYADGRNHRKNLGRHSLGTRDRDEARRLLAELDRAKARELGLVPDLTPTVPTPRAPLLLEEGRRLYESHIRRPVVTGGLQPSTLKKYRSHLDKLVSFLQSVGLHSWDEVALTHLEGYANRLKEGGTRGVPYSDKSIVNELTFAKQLIKWLIESGHLPGKEPVKLKLVKAESQRPYC